MKSYPSEKNAMGTIRYNEDVIKAMVGIALNGIEGVAGIEGRGTGNILGRKYLSHVNKIAVEEKRVSLDLSIVVKYGLPLRDVAQQVQQKVKEIIESMTDLNVGAINITVSGLDINE
jgi:uncharacterized alkaline shock family protein YloU